jgi:ubiquinone/menaquinone biosynthesis C-methylase UbiE
MKESEQAVESKRGEIAFRRKLFQQQVEGERVFEDEYSAEDILEIMRERMEKTRRQMAALVAQDVSISPYIELGAERGQRALVLENDFDARGFALDLSYESLRSAAYLAERFGLERQPVCVCCDAYNLPFRNNAIPFTFCYNTLHHFPDPTPIVAELYRVMAPGAFFFDEEPFKQLLRIVLYKRKPPRTIEARRRRGVLTKVVETLFSEMAPGEVAYGIIENEDITPAAWRRILDVFDEAEATLESPGDFVRSSLYSSGFSPRYLATKLLGGNILGLCKKTVGQALALESAWDALGCPNCRVTGVRGGEDRAPLRRADAGLRCTNCGCEFPVRDGVLFLFTAAEMEKLYPELVGGQGEV